MDPYQCIIAAVNLEPKSDHATIERAKKLASNNNAKLYLIHAIESLNPYGMGYAYPAIPNVEDEIWGKHKKELVTEAEKQGIASDALIIEIGTSYTVIVNQAKKLKADLIIIGIHGRHGLRSLLGSTTDSVLHHAPCDILAIRLQN